MYVTINIITLFTFAYVFFDLLNYFDLYYLFSINFSQKLPGEELIFESMKRILTENNNNYIVEDEKRMQLSQFFRNAPFQDLVSKTQSKV